MGGIFADTGRKLEDAMSISGKQIADILGPVDEALQAEILAVDPTVGELAEAWAWTNDDEALIGEGRPLPTGKTAALIDILEATIDPED